MRNKRKINNKGFTMAELMIVVAIITVLSAVAFIAVQTYQRRMKQLEYNGIAKEIYVAAQNHLTMVKGQGYLGRTANGTPYEGINKEYKDKEVSYFIVNSGIISDPSSSGKKWSDSVLELMLPFASVDETVRMGGNYIIVYQKTTGQVIDVYYSGSDNRFKCDFNDTDLSAEGLPPIRTNSDSLRNYKGGKVVGYYGSESSDIIIKQGEKIDTPKIEVKNGARLEVIIKNPNVKTEESSAEPKENVQLKLIIKGKTSGISKSITLIEESGTVIHNEVGVESTSADASLFTVVLDDITSDKREFKDKNNIPRRLGTHFNELFCLENEYAEGSGVLIPGEEIEIKAVAFNNKEFTNIAESTICTTNSLFADETLIDPSHGSTAYISNIRHLENLANGISNIDANNDNLKYSKAIQTTDLSWDGFVSELSSETHPKIKVYTSDSSKSSDEDYFIPITTNYTLSYDGNYLENTHSIEGISVKDTGIKVAGEGEGHPSLGCTGIFSTLKPKSMISNLELIDIEAIGTNAAFIDLENNSHESGVGSLIGYANDITITNVLSHTSEGNSSITVTGSTNVGGLIGIMNVGTVQKCASTLLVSNTGTGNNTTAGGLIGKSEGGTVVASYSGGHTDGSTGMYSSDSYNVTSTAGRAGGLIGDSSRTIIQYSYSTCSVSGTTAGGLIGSATNGTIENNYALGLVDKTKTTIGAFIGSLTLTPPSTLSNTNKYYDIINEYYDETAKEVKYLKPVGNTDSNITAIDENAETFNSFAKNDKTAFPFDNTLHTRYYDKYFFTTVIELYSTSEESIVTVNDFVSSHYGDWPSPEIFVFNDTNSTNGTTGDTGNGDNSTESTHNG